MSTQRGERTKELLLKAAVERFSEHGYDGTTTRAIAETAGVSEALIFRHFPTKLALFHAVIMRYGSQALHADPLVVPVGTPLREVIKIQCTGFLDVVWKNRVGFHTLLGAALIDDVANNDLKVLDIRLHDHLSSLFGQFEASGELKPGVVEETVDILSFAIRGFVYVAMRSEYMDWAAERTLFVNHLGSVIMRGLISEKNNPDANENICIN